MAELAATAPRRQCPSDRLPHAATRSLVFRNTPRLRGVGPANGEQVMTHTPMPVLQIRNYNGGAWCVHAEFPDGSSDDIKGFKTENDANHWIATELQHWLETREQKSNA
jgi:hypothetical protein